MKTNQLTTNGAAPKLAAKSVRPDYLARIFSGDRANRPVVVVPGRQAPHLAGESYHAESRTGIRASMAALKRYWSTYHYVASTVRTEVGADWLTRRRNRGEYHRADGVRCVVLPGRAARVGHVRVVPGWVTPSRDRVWLVTRGARSYHAARSGKINEITREAVEAAAAEAVVAWRRADDVARIGRSALAGISGVRVTLADSRHAGNCVEGSLAFAERKLGIPRAEVLGAAHLFSVPAKRLLEVANEDRPRVEAAIRVAWLRETTVSI